MRALLAVTVLAGCYDPGVDACAIRCERSGESCPGDLVCGDDFHCHADGEPETCTFPVSVTFENPLMLPPVTVLGGGIDCPETCEIEVLGGTRLELGVPKPAMLEPATDVVFVDFDNCGDEGPAGRNGCTVDVKAPTEIVARLQPGRFFHVEYLDDGVGTVSSEPKGITCRAAGDDGCTNVFGRDEQVALTATPVTPTEFGGWSVVACGSDLDCLVPSAVDTVSAAFDVLRLSVTSVGQGTDTINIVEVDGDGVVLKTFPPCTASSCNVYFGPDERPNVHLTATTDLTRRLDAWFGVTACEPLPALDTCTITGMATDTVAVGVFEAKLNLTLNVSEGTFLVAGNPPCPPNGPASAAVCTYYFDPGDPVAITAEADPGRMLGWSGMNIPCIPPGPFSPGNPFTSCNFNIAKNVNLTGEFDIPVLTIADVPGNNNAFVTVTLDGTLQPNLKCQGSSQSLPPFAVPPISCPLIISTGTAVVLEAGGQGPQGPFNLWINCPNPPVGNRCSFVHDRTVSVTPDY